MRATRDLGGEARRDGISDKNRPAQQRKGIEMKLASAHDDVMRERRLRSIYGRYRHWASMVCAMYYP